jgi:hypothetical protein
MAYGGRGIGPNQPNPNQLRSLHKGKTHKLSSFSENNLWALPIREVKNSYRRTALP